MGSSEAAQKRKNEDSSASTTSNGGEASDSDSADDTKDMEMAPLEASTERDDLATHSRLGWLILNTKKNAKVLWACSLYSFCSVSMVLVNKSLASR
jgi:hypothetical protein